MTLREKADAVAKLAADCEGCNDPICQIRLRMGADAIESVAREFGEACIRASLSEYEIHARGVPARLIELAIEAAAEGK